MRCMKGPPQHHSCRARPPRPDPSLARPQPPQNPEIVSLLTIWGFWKGWLWAEGRGLPRGGAVSTDRVRSSGAAGVVATRRTTASEGVSTQPFAGSSDRDDMRIATTLSAALLACAAPADREGDGRRLDSPAPSLSHPAAAVSPPLVAYVGGPPIKGTVGADGGTLSRLLFAAVGDTRPATADDTGGYPTDII